MIRRHYVHIGIVFALSSLAAIARAQQPDWKPVTTDLLKRENTGFGGLCGIVVDHGTGEVWVNLSDRGMFRSQDLGDTWSRAGDMQPRGRTETPGCWLIDPTGATKRMVTALVYGEPIAISDDQAGGWRYLDQKSRHVDWCAVDWSDPEMRFVLALKHEARGMLLASRDGGQSFQEVDEGYGTGWVFDNRTAVVARAKSRDEPDPELMRTTDGGETFRSCGKFSPVGIQSAQALPKLRENMLYWLVEGGLIATSDRGESWRKLGEVKDARYGPIFGRDARHLFVLTGSGVAESADGGATWSTPIPPPAGMNGIRGLSWLEYDPVHDTLYLMKMGSDLYRLKRER